MVTETEDLKQTLQEVEKHLKQEGFTIFYGYETARSRYVTEVVWEEQKSGWRGFLRTAKEADAKLVVVQASSLEKQQLQEMLPEDQQETKGSEAVSELKKHLGKIGHIGLFWFRDGVKYSLGISTNWWLQSLITMGTRYPPEERRGRPIEVPDDVKKKSDNELADELVAFVQKTFPEEVDRISFMATRQFWESKGLSRLAYLDVEEPKIKLKIDRAEALAQFRLKQETRKREKELIPKLVEECASWAKENGLKKVNKTNIDSFMAEKELTLSKLSRDVVYSKVNIVLAK